MRDHYKEFGEEMDTNEGEIEMTRPKKKLIYQPKEQSYVLDVSKCPLVSSLFRLLLEFSLVVSLKG